MIHMHNTKSKLNALSERVLGYTISAILSFALGCTVLAAIDRFFGISAESLGTMIMASFVYFLTRSFLATQISIQSLRRTMYFDSVLLSPLAYSLMILLNMTEIFTAGVFTAIFTCIAYYISLTIPVTAGQLKILRYISWYLTISALCSMFGFGLYKITGINLLPYVERFFPSMLFSVIAIPLSVFGINLYIQTMRHVATQIHSEEELEVHAIITASAISSFIIRIFIRILDIMARNKHRR